MGNTKQENDKLEDNQPPKAFDRFTCNFEFGDFHLGQKACFLGQKGYQLTKVPCLSLLSIRHFLPQSEWTR